MSNTIFGLDGKRALVIGGASGMGAAAAKLAGELGAELTVMDVADIPYPTAKSLKVDLSNQANVDEVVDSLEGSFDVIFSCAGVALGTPGIMEINFISQRHIIETLNKRDQIAASGSIVLISSAAGYSWQKNLDQVLDFLSTPDWNAAQQWLDGFEAVDGYSFSKQAINAYVAKMAYPLMKKNRIRINAVMPGPTDTPLARANADTWLVFGEEYRKEVGIEALTPEQIAQTMVYLGCDAASGVSGITMLVDMGHIASGIVGAYEDPIVDYVIGRT